MLAQSGYLCFVLDMYGRANLSLDEAREQSRILTTDAALLRRRARAALDVLAGQPHCDTSKLGAIGFCLGGIVALELARDRTPIRCAMKQASADWQLHVFGGVGHSFTNPDIDALGIAGFAYNERANNRAWNLMLARRGIAREASLTFVGRFWYRRAS